MKRCLTYLDISFASPTLLGWLNHPRCCLPEIVLKSSKAWLLSCCSTMLTPVLHRCPWAMEEQPLGWRKRRKSSNNIRSLSDSIATHKIFAWYFLEHFFFDDGWNQSWYFFDFLLKTPRLSMVLIVQQISKPTGGFSTIAGPFKITHAETRYWCGEGCSDPTAPWTHQSLGIFFAGDLDWLCRWSWIDRESDRTTRDYRSGGRGWGVPWLVSSDSWRLLMPILILFGLATFSVKGRHSTTQ